MQTNPTPANQSRADLRNSGGSAAYGDKNREYFAGARADYVTALPANSAAVILEVGCGNGNTGRLALAEQKCSRYCGLELDETAARTARECLSEVVVGDVEKIVLPWPEKTFDAVIMSEVLEHLVDPWAALRKIRPLLRAGALVFASSPNASHFRIVRMLAQGRWDLQDHGAMDRTHLRWFTPITYQKMFESCGYHVDKIGPLTPLNGKAKALCALMGGWGKHLFTYQISVQGHCD